MGKEILAAIVRGDEAKTFRVVEPLDGARSHFQFLISIIRAIPDPETGHDDQGRELTATSSAARGAPRVLKLRFDDLRPHCTRMGKIAPGGCAPRSRRSSRRAPARAIRALAPPRGAG